MGTDRKGFLLRLPPDLLDEIRGWAEQEMRSLNAQIEWLLRDALRARKRARSTTPPIDPTPREPDSGAGQ